MKITNTELFIQLLFITISAWFIVSGFSIETQEIEVIDKVETLIIKRNTSLIIQLLCCITIAVIMLYSNIYLLLKNYKKLSLYRTLLYSFLLLAGSIVACLFIPQNISRQELILPISLSAGIPIFYYTLSVAYGFGKIWLNSEKEAQQLLIDKKQAELNLLRNQLQPHFLFNALNNLLALVDQKQSPLLATSFDHLSQLLRYVIDESRAEKSAIGKEIAFIQHYAALQLLRFEPGEVLFNLDLQGDNDEQAIESDYSFLCEKNAFKYGTEPEGSSEINVSFDIRNPEEVIFRVKNKIFESYQGSESTGTGIPSTKNRLNLVYPEKHTLKIDSADYFYVEIKISTV